MQASANRIDLDEASGRRVVLAQAIEDHDPEHRLISQTEREQIDRQSLDAARPAQEGAGVATLARVLRRRADLVLQAAGQRDRHLVALQDPSIGERWITAGLPLGALLLGVFTDQIANPHQVNLLSKPLLLLLAWNLVVYLLLLAGLLLARRRGVPRARFTPLRQWLASLRGRRRRSGHVRSDVTAAFLTRWHGLTTALYGQRIVRVMHLSAAAWALGVALSLFFGGFLASYVVQWESTFLTASDVHRFLSLLFLPVTALFPDAAFSLADIRSLHAVGATGLPVDAESNVTGRRWVFLYTVLLAQVVVLPRLLLAAAAFWRERRLARHVPLDLSQPYFQRLMSALSPARVQFCLYTHRKEDRAAMLRMLHVPAEISLRGAGSGPGELHEVLRGAAGEELFLLDLSHVADAVDLAEALSCPGRQPVNWFGRLRESLLRRPPRPLTPLERALRTGQESDVVLHVVADSADLEVAQPLLDWLGKPVLRLVHGEGETAAALLARCRAEPGPVAPSGVASMNERASIAAAPAMPPVAATGAAPPRALAFEQFSGCWVQEPVLLDALAALVPVYKQPGFAQLAAAWEQRNLNHLRESMLALAAHLLLAARHAEEVGKPPNPLLGALRPGEREGHEQRVREAMARIVQRLGQSDGQAVARLREIHGAHAMPVPALRQLPPATAVPEAISPSQAGAAGAASGAAVGVSIDLLTAGLSLGLAAAAGALVGGGSAWAAAVWKKRATAAGGSVVQLSDDMLQALVEAGLLRYLAVIHYGRAGDQGEPIRPGWTSEVVAAVERRNADLKDQWASVRARHELLDPSGALVSMLESIALAVLRRLYPQARLP
jgi:hypothetical protein